MRQCSYQAGLLLGMLLMVAALRLFGWYVLVGGLVLLGLASYTKGFVRAGTRLAALFLLLGGRNTNGD